MVAGVINEPKKKSGLKSITPSANPVALLKLLIRPLMKIIKCDGPTAPIESGGNAPVWDGPLTPSNVSPTVCANDGPEIVPAEPVAALERSRACPGAGCRSNVAAGSCGRNSRPG